MHAKTELDFDVLIETEKNKIDEYYKRLKRNGWMDFVDDFVIPDWAEEGVRIATELNYPLTIKTDHIGVDNTLNLLGQIKSLRSI